MTPAKMKTDELNYIPYVWPRFKVLTACSDISRERLSRFTADPLDKDTGLQSWLVSRVYAALKRCAAQHAEYPTHRQLLFMVVDVVSRFNSTEWTRTRAGRNRKHSVYQTPCLHCSECVAAIQDIDRDRRANKDDCLKPETVVVTARRGDPLPHDLKSWRLALIRQCYDSGYVQGRGWLASDERPAAIGYMKNFRHVDRIQSLRPLDIVSGIHVSGDGQPEMIRLAEAQLSNLVDADQLETAGYRFAQAAPEFKPDGTKSKAGGKPYKVGFDAVGRLTGKTRGQVKHALKNLENVMDGKAKIQKSASPGCPKKSNLTMADPSTAPAGMGNLLAWMLFEELGIEWKVSPPALIRKPKAYRKLTEADRLDPDVVVVDPISREPRWMFNDRPPTAPAPATKTRAEELAEWGERQQKRIEALEAMTTPPEPTV